MSAIIKIEDLHYTYPGDEAETLKGIDLEIEEGSFVAVLGHNGSGKSTLAKHFNAILTPTEGKVLVDGMDTADENNLLAVRRTVGMLRGHDGLYRDNTFAAYTHIHAEGAPHWAPLFVMALRRDGVDVGGAIYTTEQLISAVERLRKGAGA